jgi:hypothetical protein
MLMKKTKKSKDVSSGLIADEDADLAAHRAEQEEDKTAAVNALAAVPIGTVAIVAAILTRPKMNEHDSIIKAYKLLELAALGQNSLGRKLNFPWLIPTGVIGTIGMNEDPVPLTEEEEKHLEEQYKAHQLDMRLEDLLENPKPFYPFEETLKEIIPKAGKTSNRLPLFRKWLMEKFKLTLGDAGDKIAEWKRSGIPNEIFRIALVSYPKWRVYTTKEERKKAAAKSRKNKGKQGRVKSKNDKRLGARPPYDKMGEALGR